MLECIYTQLLSLVLWLIQVKQIWRLRVFLFSKYFLNPNIYYRAQKTNYSKGEYCFGNIHCFLLVVGESSSSYSSLNSPGSFSDGSSRIFPPLIYRMFVFIYIIFIMS